MWFLNSMSSARPSTDWWLSLKNTGLKPGQPSPHSCQGCPSCFCWCCWCCCCCSLKRELNVEHPGQPFSSSPTYLGYHVIRGIWQQLPSPHSCFRSPSWWWWWWMTDKITKKLKTCQIRDCPTIRDSSLKESCLVSQVNPKTPTECLLRDGFRRL